MSFRVLVSGFLNFTESGNSHFCLPFWRSTGKIISTSFVSYLFLDKYIAREYRSRLV